MSTDRFLEHIFLMTLAKALLKVIIAPWLLNTRIFLYPSASSPEGLEPTLVFSTAFIMFSSIYSNTIGCTIGFSPLNNTSSFNSFDSGWFCYRRFKVLSSTGSVLLDRLLVNIFNKLLRQFPDAF